MNNVNELRFSKCRNVKSPTRAHETDAGIDLYMPIDLNRRDVEQTYRIIAGQNQNALNAFLPAKTPIFDYNTGTLKTWFLMAGEQALIPSGIRVNVPKGYVLKIENKSSIATQKSLIVGSCIVDSGFQGEILINVHYVGKPGTGAAISAGDKIAQAVLYKIETPEIVEVGTTVDLFKDDGTSERGEGGFGSTGNN